jgi:ATP-dependent Clp protease adapter protein ClpS
MSQYPHEPPSVPPDESLPPQQRVPQVRRPQPGALPPYRVVLLKNNDLDLMFVVRTVMELTRFCRAEATHKMWEAYHYGRSQLLVTHKERAELYVEQFASRKLVVTIEPA